MGDAIEGGGGGDGSVPRKRAMSNMGWVRGGRLGGGSGDTIVGGMCAGGQSCSKAEQVAEDDVSGAVSEEVAANSGGMVAAWKGM
ncbi:hypothetical protein L3X38_016532 [Prunus dulcis]|uniref:Uncharacterized protein n=1 Tax=Prunus dulcis TaxID=3755 RepID=A0AAD4W5K2_PRUDU|nr:hypothetical protein L3X38_016532 [Prunus dulcis]